MKEFKAEKTEKPTLSDEEYYEYLHRNLSFFEEIMKNSGIKLKRNEETLRQYITIALTQGKSMKNYETNYLNKLLKLLEQGSLRKQEINKINKNLKGNMNPDMIYIKIKEILSDEIMNIELVEEEDDNINYQVLLSEYKK